MTDTRPWTDPNVPPRQRAEALVAAMPLENKIAQLHGAMATIDIYAVSNAIDPNDSEAMTQLAEQVRVERHVDADEQFGIPRMRVTNGPVGVGMGDGTPSPPATALPMTIGVAASFDTDLASRYGDVIGAEAAALGQHVLEGPAVCLHRTATAGRNFEYFSEDPYLSGAMGVAVARAIQSHGVITMVKHFAVNDQEHERFRVNVEVDEHVLREMYLLPFEMVVKDAEVAAVMSAYNRVRGHYATESRYLLNDVLRRDWGFTGYVQSDFWATRSAAASLTAGLDLEMPDGKWCNEALVTAALADTSLEVEVIDRALVRRFTQMFRFGQFDRPYAPTPIDAAGHGAIAREIGAQMAVLLKNDPVGDAPLLPLAPEGRIVVVGQSRFARFATQGGGGSSRVDPLYTVDPVPGLRDVIAELGGVAQVSSVIVDDDLANLDDAVAAARDADTVVVMAGLVATEGADLPSMEQPCRQGELVAAVLGANPRTVVVLKDSSPVLLPWIDQASAVLEVWNQGAEDGHVVADLLLGRVNPSGKVPTSYPRHANDTLIHGHPERYPGVDLGEGFPTITYSEGLQMGYRWHQATGVKPLFAFGFGLSYTSFEVDEVVVDAGGQPGAEPLRVSVRVTNTGRRSGAEVVQVYLGVPGGVGEPPKRLVGFAKVQVDPGASERVEIVIDPDASHHPLSVWSYADRGFVVPRGVFTVYVGTSSDDDSFVSTFEVV